MRWRGGSLASNGIWWVGQGRADWLAWAMGKAHGSSTMVAEEARYVPRGSNLAGEDGVAMLDW